ncbi:MAG: CoA-binding protein [Dehalococcoidia bacterium]
MTQHQVELFAAIFSPRSIAVVGVSSNEDNMAAGYIRSLLNAGFQGALYPVGPRGDHLFGLKVYPNAPALPAGVDYAIICVAAPQVPEVVGDLGAKGVKVAHIYAAGFRESGREGYHLEREVVARAQQAGLHIVGPNSMGVSCPASRIPYGSVGRVGEPGSVVFFSQSAGLAGDLEQEGLNRHLRFSKLVSFGNGCDLGIADYLGYFMADPETRIIGAYLEGVGQGQQFLRLAKEIRGRKPLVVWKGGTTRAGAEAAASHTGAMAMPDAIFRGAVKQVGAVLVESLEEMADTLLAFQQLGRWQGKRVAIVSGIGGGGGGLSVSACDVCAKFALEVPPFGQETFSQLLSYLSPVGRILRNPVDMGGGGYTLETMGCCLQAALNDPNIDALIVQEHLGKIVHHAGMARAEAINKIIAQIAVGSSKTVAVVCTPGLAFRDLPAIETALAQAGIAVFPTFMRAARSLSNIGTYWQSQTGDRLQVAQGKG